MKALVLCAGFGVRLKPLTFKVPKPMIKIGGHPVLEHLIFHLSKFGITQVIINLHYKPEEFMNYFGTRLLYLFEPTLLGEEKTIASLGHWLWSDYTVVMNGDTLTNINISEMFKWSGGKNVMSMDGKTYTGTKILSPQYFLKGDRKFSKYYDAGLYWRDIGTFENLKKAKKEYGKRFNNLSELSEKGN